MDIEAITWLEDFLTRWTGTLIFVTHDRMFLRHLADRILEIDRGKLFDWTCDYDTFLKRKEAVLDAEEKQNALFDKKLAQEEVVDPPGHQGAADTQRRPRASADRNAAHEAVAGFPRSGQHAH